MVGRFADLFVDRRLVVFPGEHVPAPAVFRLPFGRLPGAWRDDGRAFAFCFTTPQGPVVRVVRRGGWRTIADACHPAWLGNRLVVARLDPAAVAVGGTRIVGGRALARLLPGRPPPASVSVRSLGAGGGRIVVGLAAGPRRVEAPQAAAVAVLSRAGSLESRRGLPRGSLPAAVGLVATGRRFWYFDATRREAHSFSVTGQWPLPLRGAGWLAWSPDARYVAAATGRGLVLADRRGEEVALLPVRAQEVAWTLTPRRGAERRAG